MRHFRATRVRDRDQKRKTKKETLLANWVFARSPTSLNQNFVWKNSFKCHVSSKWIEGVPRCEVHGGRNLPSRSQCFDRMDSLFCDSGAVGLCALSADKITTEAATRVSEWSMSLSKL